MHRGRLKGEASNMRSSALLVLCALALQSCTTTPPQATKLSSTEQFSRSEKSFPDSATRHQLRSRFSDKSAARMIITGRKQATMLPFVSSIILASEYKGTQPRIRRRLRTLG